MARLAAKTHLIASLNAMLAASAGLERPALTQDEIIEIITAMAESEAMSTAPPIEETVHWQNGPRRVL